MCIGEMYKYASCKCSLQKIEGKNLKIYYKNWNVHLMNIKSLKIYTTSMNKCKKHNNLHRDGIVTVIFLMFIYKHMQ